jgi:nucleoside-diphosphate-sugar epimerase
MRVLLAGATGTLGRRLLPMLVEAGHDVVGTTRSPEKLDVIAHAGAEAVVMDGLDASSVDATVDAGRPDVVVHQMTALATIAGNLRRFDDEFAQTNRLRTAGTDHLLAAATRSGVKRFVVQSFTGWPNARSGPMVVDETAPLDPSPSKASARTLAAIEYLERTVPQAGVDGIVLRYGAFYGPGTGLGQGGDLADMVARRRFPVVGGGAGIFSFCHIDDAASATVAALDRGAPGVYNVVDDHPAPVREWLPYLAALLGARPPMRVPAWMARPLVGDFGVGMMTTTRGSSNAKARAELGWQPGYPSWREGFRAEFG